MKFTMSLWFSFYFHDDVIDYVCFKKLRHSDAYMCQWIGPSVQGMTYSNENTFWILDSFNSLWPSWCLMAIYMWVRLVQIMACCLVAPSHFLNQYWFVISRILHHPPKGSSTGNTHENNHGNACENCTFIIKATSRQGTTRVNWYRDYKSNYLGISFSVYRWSMELNPAVRQEDATFLTTVQKPLWFHPRCIRWLWRRHRRRQRHQ